MIKVFLKRQAKKEVANELKPLLIKLRDLAVQQPGYISGETLVNVDLPQEHMVISTWQSKDDWDSWIASEKRKAVQDNIDKILDGPTLFSVYYNG